MANLRRRSARLSKTGTNQSSARKTPVSNVSLGSLVERDETPDTVTPSIDRVLATPTASRTTAAHLRELEVLKTPQTEPKPEQAEMNPKTLHRSTAKAPDSGLKLGFSDITKDRRYDTPSRSAGRHYESAAPAFEFQFTAESRLSKDAQKLMENVREDAARIKTQMLAEKTAQDQKDHDAEKMFGADRKFARPKGKVGRFSDVHMAQFKKMDSIANHASAFRAKSGFAAPTTQTLKRSLSKAGLDDPERPRTPGNVTTPRSRRLAPPIIGRPDSVSPFKSIPVAQSHASAGSAKRARQSELQDVSDSRPTSSVAKEKPSNLYSPTKSSVARTTKPTTPSGKSSKLSRSNSVKSNQSVRDAGQATARVSSPEGVTGSVSAWSSPFKAEQPLYPTLPGSPSVDISESKVKSRIPTLSGLKSIMRGSRKVAATTLRPGTPKRLNNVDRGSDSLKKVDFTPSVKSRHAVKLAVDNPSPAKRRRDTPYKSSGPIIPYDPSAYVIPDELTHEWKDSDGDLQYPSLPLPSDSGSPIEETFSTRSKELNRRESKEFKSIFTNLHPSSTVPAGTLTSTNTVVNTTDPQFPTSNVMRYPSRTSTRPPSSTIRQVRTSSATASVQMPDNGIGAVPHGLSGKKRRLDAIHDIGKHDHQEDAKENRQLPFAGVVPGGWGDSGADEVESESMIRGGKRMRVSAPEEKTSTSNSPVKKTNVAREAAAKNAKERKGRGVLSLARLNMLSRPKTRS